MKIRLSECCGGACARIGAVLVAKSCHGDLEQWLAMLVKWLGSEEYVRRDRDSVHVICSEFLCNPVKDAPERLPDTFCYYTRGWMKETFETVVGKPMDVDLIESIKHGASRCKIAIRL